MWGRSSINTLFSFTYFTQQKNRHDSSTAARYRYTSTTGSTAAPISYERRFKVKLRLWHRCFGVGAPSWGGGGGWGLHWGRALRMALTSSATAVRANSNWSWKREEALQMLLEPKPIKLLEALKIKAQGDVEGCELKSQNFQSLVSS